MSKTDNYLGSKRLDDIARMVTELASEVWILRDRNLLLEHLLAEKGTVDLDKLEEMHPEGELSDKIHAERTAFVRRVFGSVLDQETRVEAGLER